MEKLPWHKSSGIIKYDPHRFGMKNRTEWWAVLEVDKEITRYYRHWIDKDVFNPLGLDHDGMSKAVRERYPYKKLQPPSWDAHVSIIRGEKPRHDLMHLWKKYDGMEVDFLYKHHPRFSGDTTGGDRGDHYWFVEVFCPKLLEIREELNRPTNWKLHMTVGRTYD